MNITRRLFLRSTASAGAVAAIGVAPAASAELLHDENPDLLRLGREMEDAEAALVAAEEAKAVARQRFEAMVPDVPADLVVPLYDTKDERHWLRFAAERERDCFQDLVPGGRMIVCSYRFASQFEYALKPCRGRPSEYQKKVRRIYDLAKGHEAAVEEARVLHVDEAWRAAAVIRNSMHDMAKLISETEARTIHGVVIKAMSYKRLARSCEDHSFNIGKHYLATDVADSLLTVAEGRVSCA